MQIFFRPRNWASVSVNLQVFLQVAKLVKNQNKDNCGVFLLTSCSIYFTSLYFSVASAFRSTGRGPLLSGEKSTTRAVDDGHEKHIGGVIAAMGGCGPWAMSNFSSTTSVDWGSLWWEELNVFLRGKCTIVPTSMCIAGNRCWLLVVFPRHQNNIVVNILCTTVTCNIWKISSRQVGIVRYHCGGSMELNARILLLAYMVYL
jgi:hypothetical protein